MLRTVLLASLACIASMCIGARSAHATLYYASATSGGDPLGGDTLGPEQFIGVRFAVASPTTVNGVGGNFLEDTDNDGHPLFGAIIKLDSFTDFPDSIDLSTPDVLESFPIIPSATLVDLFVPIAPLDLDPGVYGFLVGSDLFGATGGGYIPISTDIGSPSYFWKDSTDQWRNDLPPGRLTVYSESSVPEPATYLLFLAVGVALAKSILSRRT